jgi:ribosomal protein L37AE/L43A
VLFWTAIEAEERGVKICEECRQVMTVRHFATHTVTCAAAMAARAAGGRVKLVPVTTLLVQKMLPGQAITALGTPMMFTTPFESRLRGRTLPAATEMGAVAWASRLRTAAFRFNPQQLSFLHKSFDSVPKISEQQALVNMKRLFNSTDPDDPYYKRWVLKELQIKGWFGSEKRRRAVAIKPRVNPKP